MEKDGRVHIEQTAIDDGEEDKRLRNGKSLTKMSTEHVRNAG